MTLFRKHLWANRSDLLVELAIPAGLWLLTELIVEIAQAVTGELIPIGGVPAAFALFGGAFMELLCNAARMYTGYPIGVSMSRTRRCMLALTVGESAVHLALVALQGLLLNLVSLGVGGLLGTVAEKSLFAIIPWWVWPIVAFSVLAFGLASGLVFMAFGQKGFWVLWGVFMLAFVVPMNSAGSSFNIFALPPAVLFAGAALAGLVLLGWLVWSVWYALRCPIRI